MVLIALDEACEREVSGQKPTYSNRHPPVGSSRMREHARCVASEVCELAFILVNTILAAQLMSSTRANVQSDLLTPSTVRLYKRCSLELFQATVSA